MKKKLLPAIIGAILTSILLVSPVFAIIPQGVYFNHNQYPEETEWMLRVVWTGHPTTEVKLNEFWLGKKETTALEVENRIREQILDGMYEDVLWNQLDPEEEPAFSGILSPGEEIVYTPQQKLRVWKGYFNIHIETLDNPETPICELKFHTKFYPRRVVPGGKSYDEVFPDGWWG